LTDDGIEYVKELAAEERDRGGVIGEVVQGWLDFYGIELEECLSPTTWLSETTTTVESAMTSYR